MLTIPPGFNRGLVFNEDGQSLINKPDENRKKKTFGDLPNVNLFELIWNETGTVGELLFKSCKLNSKNVGCFTGLKKNFIIVNL